MTLYTPYYSYLASFDGDWFGELAAADRIFPDSQFHWHSRMCDRMHPYDGNTIAVRHNGPHCECSKMCRYWDEAHQQWVRTTHLGKDCHCFGGGAWCKVGEWWDDYDGELVEEYDDWLRSRVLGPDGEPYDSWNTQFACADEDEERLEDAYWDYDARLHSTRESTLYTRRHRNEHERTKGAKSRRKEKRAKKRSKRTKGKAVTPSWEVEAEEISTPPTKVQVVSLYTLAYSQCQLCANRRCCLRRKHPLCPSCAASAKRLENYRLYQSTMVESDDDDGYDDFFDDLFRSRRRAHKGDRFWRKRGRVIGTTSSSRWGPSQYATNHKAVRRRQRMLIKGQRSHRLLLDLIAVLPQLRLLASLAAAEETLRLLERKTPTVHRLNLWSHNRDIANQIREVDFFRREIYELCGRLY